MYFVDLKLLHQRLTYMEQLVNYLLDEKHMPVNPGDDGGSLTIPLAYERALHLAIEIILDVGHQMIDGFMMRDPGSYEDVLDILVDEEVLTDQEGEQLKRLIAHRKQLVQHYIQVEHEKIQSGVEEAQEALQRFPERVKDYLTHQLGPVHAFKQGE